MRKMIAAITSLVVLAIVGGIVYTIAAYNHERTQTCTVVDKESVSTQDGHEYRVYTEDCGNFVVADALFKGNFHASDTYARIDVDTTYELTTMGWRVPFFSMFPNIIDAQEVR